MAERQGIYQDIDRGLKMAVLTGCRSVLSPNFVLRAWYRLLAVRRGCTVCVAKIARQGAFSGSIARYCWTSHKTNQATTMMPKTH
jgi:hypothetical protein